MSYNCVLSNNHRVMTETQYNLLKLFQVYLEHLKIVKLDEGEEENQIIFSFYNFTDTITTV